MEEHEAYGEVSTSYLLILFPPVAVWYSVTVKPEYQWIGQHTVLVPSSSGLEGIRID